MLLSSLLAVMLLNGAGQQPKSIYNQVVVHPDQNNGYEDYLRAADKITKTDIDVYLGWSPEQYGRMLESKAEYEAALKRPPTKEQNEAVAMTGWSPADESKLALAKSLHDLDYLGVQRAMLARYGQALDFARAGNQKRVYDPREKLSSDTLFPEFSAFKTIAKMFAADAYVRFADGDPDRATDDLLEGMAFSRNIITSSLISYLVGVASQSIVLAAAEANLSRIDNAGAAKLVRYADASMREPSPFAAVMQSDKAFTLSAIDEILSGTARDWGLGDDVEKYLSSMSAADRTAAKTRIARQLSSFYDAFDKRLQGPEEQWYVKPAEDQSQNRTINSLEDFSDAIVEMMAPSLDASTMVCLKNRAQIRLLGLHGRIIRYRWLHGRLPTTLSDVAPEELLRDPLGKAAFHYEVTEAGYRLYSEGTEQTGPIELKYRRRTPMDDTSPIPPQGARR